MARPGLDNTEAGRRPASVVSGNCPGEKGERLIPAHPCAVSDQSF